MLWLKWVVWQSESEKSCEEINSLCWNTNGECLANGNRPQLGHYQNEIVFLNVLQNTSGIQNWPCFNIKLFHFFRYAEKGNCLDCCRCVDSALGWVKPNKQCTLHDVCMIGNIRTNPPVLVISCKSKAGKALLNSTISRNVAVTILLWDNATPLKSNSLPWLAGSYRPFSWVRVRWRKQRVGCWRDVGSSRGAYDHTN